MKRLSAFLIAWLTIRRRRFAHLGAGVLLFTNLYAVDLADYPQGQHFTEVTDSLGPLAVKIGKFKIEAPVKPWSAWWYPRYDQSLFLSMAGKESPLNKYDAVYAVLAATTESAASFEEKNLYDPGAARWSGLCNAWALASILAPEPQYPVNFDGIRFEVEDLKALVLKTYETTAGLVHFGQRNNGSLGDEYMDLYPEQFHKFMQSELFDKKRPFLVDDDAGIEVWNVPVWAATTEITADSDDPKLLHVSTWLSIVKSTQDKNFVGSKAGLLNYTYDLFGAFDGDTFWVEYGVWTHQAQRNHPDFITQIPAIDQHESRNPYIKNQIVQKILAAPRAAERETQPSDKPFHRQPPIDKPQERPAPSPPGNQPIYTPPLETPDQPSNQPIDDPTPPDPLAYFRLITPHQMKMEGVNLIFSFAQPLPPEGTAIGFDFNMMMRIKRRISTYGTVVENQSYYHQHLARGNFFLQQTPGGFSVVIPLDQYGLYTQAYQPGTHTVTFTTDQGQTVSFQYAVQTGP